MTPIALRKLRATGELLQQGLEIKPGKLNVLQREFDDEIARRDFLLFLLSVTIQELPDIPAVLRYFGEVNELASGLNSPLTVQKLNVIADRLFAMQPWHKRLHVHATRRRVQYVDLYFLEMLVKGLTESRKCAPIIAWRRRNCLCLIMSICVTAWEARHCLTGTQLSIIGKGSHVDYSRRSAR